MNTAETNHLLVSSTNETMLSFFVLILPLLVVIDSVEARLHEHVRYSVACVAVVTVVSFGLSDSHKLLMLFQILERQLDEKPLGCLFCVISPVEVEYEDGESETFFDCFAQGQEADDDEIPYSIDIPEDFLSDNLSQLLSGATICIEGGEAVRSINGTGYDVIVIPEGAEISLKLDGREGLELNLTSPRSVLVVRVLGASGSEQPIESSNRLAAAVFGLGNEALNFSNSMRAQYNRCSFGKLDFEPANPPGIPQVSDGVMDIQLDFSFRGRDVTQDRAIYQRVLMDQLDVDSLTTKFDHIMFCVAPGTTFLRRGWTAFAPASTFSYYNSMSFRCDKLSALMHEIGHNLGLDHSGMPGDEYADITGIVRS